MSTEVKGIVDLITGQSLGKLVDIGFIEEGLVMGSWYTRYDMNQSLEQKAFFAAATIDNSGKPVILFNAESPLKALAWAIPHEAIHLAQMLKQDLEPCKSFTNWKGKAYIGLDANDPNYFSIDHQPWEAEARDLESIIREYIYEVYPMLR